MGLAAPVVIDQLVMIDLCRCVIWPKVPKLQTTIVFLDPKEDKQAANLPNYDRTKATK